LRRWGDVAVFAVAGHVGAFPKVRLVTLIECGTDAVFGQQSEQVLTALRS